MVSSTIPGIGTGNPGSISSGCVKNGVLMILPKGTSLSSILDGSWNASARSCSIRANCGRRRSEGNSGLILTTGRSVWRIEAELQNRFQLKCGMEFGILGSDDGLAEFLVWERKWNFSLLRVSINLKHQSTPNSSDPTIYPPRQ